MITIYKKIWFILTKHEKKRAILLFFIGNSSNVTKTILSETDGRL